MKNSKSAAQQANEIFEKLQALPEGFGRTVVAHYIAGLGAEHKKGLMKLVKNTTIKPRNVLPIPEELLD